MFYYSSVLFCSPSSSSSSTTAATKSFHAEKRCQLSDEKVVYAHFHVFSFVSLFSHPPEHLRSASTFMSIPRVSKRTFSLFFQQFIETFLLLRCDVKLLGVSHKIT